MQPYFIPYGGYFRLWAAADVVVLLDTVQFPREGWVHRNRIPVSNTRMSWLTLPVAKCKLQTPIAQLRFVPDPRSRVERHIPRFPVLVEALRAQDPLLERVLTFDTPNVATYLCDLVVDITELLGFRTPTIRASELPIKPDLRGQSRVIAIGEALGACRYINLSGGRALYEADEFAKRSMELRFLRPYGGPPESILARMLSTSTAEISAEIARETIIDY